jgi:hypothetical protein
MTSLDLNQTIAAFAVERQVLAPELSQSLREKETIAAGLLLCLSFLVGSTIGDLQIEQLDRIYPAGRNQGLIDFKLVCRSPSSQIPIHLGICVLASPDLAVVNEACMRLLVYKDFGLDRLCLIRPGDVTSNLSQLPTCLPRLLSPNIGGHFIALKSGDLFSILTILSVFRHKQQHAITTETIVQYLYERELLTKNELIKSILATAQG